MKLGLQNFQGVTDYQEVEIAPITLIYGQNSSGKSIIYDALVVGKDIFDKESSALPGEWINQSSRQGLAISRGVETMLKFVDLPRPSGWDVTDTGKWLKHRAGMQVLDNGITEHLIDLLWSPEGEQDKPKISCEYRWRERAGGVVISGYRIEIDGAWALDWASGDDHESSVVRINLDNSLVASCSGFLDESKILWRDFEKKEGVLLSNMMLEGLKCDLYFSEYMYDESYFDEDMSGRDPLFLLVAFLVSGATFQVSKCVRFFLLGALRPARTEEYIARKSSFDYDYVTDECYAWKILAAALAQRKAGIDDMFGSELEMLDKWIASPQYLGSGFALDVYVDFKAPLDDLASISRVEPARMFEHVLKNYDLIYRVVLKDLARNRIIRVEDVGVGVSQVIPVLVAAAIWEKVFIQQPELHLHPRMQASLADVFIEKKTENGGFILETHSELLVLRMLRRIRETYEGCVDSGLALRANQLSVVYVSRTPEGETFFKKLRVAPNGEFLDRWPNGFFAERDAEIFS